MAKKKDKPPEIPTTGYCCVPKIMGRPLSRPHLSNCNDLAIEGARIYRLYKAGLLLEAHYRGLFHGLKVLRDLIRDNELTELSNEILVIKETMQSNNDEVKKNGNNQQPNEE